MSDFIPSPPLTPPSHAGGSLSWGDWGRSGLSLQVEAALAANARPSDPSTVAETSELLISAVSQVRRLSRALGPSTTAALLNLVLKEDDLASSSTLRRPQPDPQAAASAFSAWAGPSLPGLPEADSAWAPVGLLGTTASSSTPSSISNASVHSAVPKLLPLSTAQGAPPPQGSPQLPAAAVSELLPIGLLE